MGCSDSSGGRFVGFFEEGCVLPASKRGGEGCLVFVGTGDPEFGERRDLDLNRHRMYVLRGGWKLRSRCSARCSDVQRCSCKITLSKERSSASLGGKGGRD